MNRGQKGFTLVQVVIVLAIGALLLGGLVGVLWQFQIIPDRASAQLVVVPELRRSANWIKFDANKAQSFAAGTAPEYGTFRWLDYSTFPATSYEVKYYLDGNTLYRQVSIDDVPSPPMTLARHIASQSDVTFAVSDGALTATITATIDTVLGNLTQSTTVEVEMRPEQTKPLKYLLYYLHNNPTPPTGDTASQTDLPLDTTKPTATTLYNYDANRDSVAGLSLDEAAEGGDLGETDTDEFQDWLMTSPLSSSIVIDGQISLFLYAAASGFERGQAMMVDAWLRDFDPATSTYTTIATKGEAGFISESTWTAISVHFSKVVQTVPAGHKLALKIQFDGESGDDGMVDYDTTGMIAYDTTSYLSYLSIPMRP